MALSFYLEQRQESSKIAESVSLPSGEVVPPAATGVWTSTLVWTTTEVVTGTGVLTGTETQTRTDSQAESDLPTESDTLTASTASTETTDSSRPSATESTVATSTSKPSNNRIDGGEVAAVAFGCLAAGVIIGVIVAWKWLPFRANRRPRDYGERHRNERGILFTEQPQDPALASTKTSTKNHPRDRTSITMQPSSKNHPRDRTSITMQPSSKKIRLENVVLQPASDQAIISDLHRLEEIIMQHVETLYHSDPVDVGVAKLANALSTLGISESLSGFHAETVAGWCLKPESRTRALKHVISQVLFRSIDWNSPGSLTLLPKHAVSFLNATRPAREDNPSNHVMLFAWTRWRTLSALLMHPAPKDRTPLEISETDTDIEDQTDIVAEALDSVLCFFVAGGQENQRKQHSHLRAMIAETAKLGYLFFSHTGEWRFIYKDDSGERRPVVCVGLDKLSGSDGHPLRSPQRIVDPRLL